MCPTFPSQLPIPILTLRLSTSTMLDTVLLDIRDSNPLFSIETAGNQTTLHRAASSGKMLSHATVQWPTSSTNYSKKEKDSTIFVDGVNMPSSAFLKKSLLGGGSVPILSRLTSQPAPRSLDHSVFPNTDSLHQISQVSPPRTK